MKELAPSFVVYTYFSRMVTSKNLSPLILSAFTAMGVTVMTGIIFYFVEAVQLDIWKTLISFFLIFSISFILIYNVLERFIYRKIKLIYKFIQQTKATKREEVYYKYILPQKSIDEVREDVERWATQNNAEVEILRTNDAYRKEFLQNLAHEFKTPIFAIQGYIDTLLGGAMDNAEVSKKFLENTSRNVDRMISLVSDLDEISNLESGQQSVNKKYFIIQDLIREVYENLSIGVVARGMTCIIKKGCEQPVNVHADKGKIHQVLTNLVDNAIKYGKDGGKISAGIYKTDDNQLLIEISDNGYGIDKVHLPRLFERFYRADRTRSRNAGGSGLGLSICKHIIEAHGQTIHARSQVGIGTTIGFTLER